MSDITELPAGFGGEVGSLPALVALDMSGNKLTKLPPKFGLALPRLAFLDINMNRLQSLPETFGAEKSLPNMFYLRLMGNMIVNLPNNFGASMPHLVAFAVDDNKLQALNGNFSTTLMSLTANSNEIRSIPPCLVDGRGRYSQLFTIALG